MGAACARTKISERVDWLRATVAHLHEAACRLGPDAKPRPIQRERLTEQTLVAHHAILSLMEELQAMDWYRPRADDCEDVELKAVLVHNMNDEMEHAAMLVEWLRRNGAEFATQLDKFVGTDGPIA